MKNTVVMILVFMLLSCFANPASANSLFWDIDTYESNIAESLQILENLFMNDLATFSSDGRTQYINAWKSIQDYQRYPQGSHFLLASHDYLAALTGAADALINLYTNNRIFFASPEAEKAFLKAVLLIQNSKDCF